MEIKFKNFLIVIILALILMNIASAEIKIEGFTHIGNNPDLKLNLTLYNSGSETVNFNITLKDTSNENINNRIIYSGSLSIGANETKSIIFGKYGSYDYDLNDNWENYRCGVHNIEAIISYPGGSASKSDSFEINADNFDVRYYIGNKEVELKNSDIKPSLGDTITIKVFKANGKPFENVNVEIRYKDEGKVKIKTTDSKGVVTFKPSYDFGKEATGSYSIKIWKHEKIDDHYYCDYVLDDIIIKRKFRISSITPENPKVNEKITVKIESDDDYYGATIWVEGGKNPMYGTLTSATYQFVLDSPGTYTINIVGKDNTWWDDSKTIVVSDYPELKIVLPEDIILDQENEFVITDKNDVPISNVNVILEDPKGRKYTEKTNYKGIVKFKLIEPGEYRIIAEKENYKTAEEKFSALRKLKILIPEEVKIYEEVKIMLLDENNMPVDGKIYIENDVYNTNQGYIIYNFTQFKEYRIKGESLGYQSVSIKVRPLKIIHIKTNKENFSVGENIEIELSGDELKNAKIEVKNLETNYTITYYGLNKTLKLYSPGSYEIIASAEGFGKAISKIFVRKLPLKIDANYDKKNILIKVTSENNPIENASITIITPGNLFAYLLTDINGTAKFDKIYETGNYTIKAEKELYSPNETTMYIEKESFEFGIFAIIALIVLILIFILIFIKRKSKGKNKEEKQQEKFGL